MPPQYFQDDLQPTELMIETVRYCMVSPSCYRIENAKKAFTLCLTGKKSVTKL